MFTPGPGIEPGDPCGNQLSLETQDWRTTIMRSGHACSRNDDLLNLLLKVLREFNLL